MIKLRLTNKQQKILVFIQLYQMNFKRAPTRGEIGRIVFTPAISPQAVDQQLRAMERKGWVKLTRQRKHRNIRIV